MKIRTRSISNTVISTVVGPIHCTRQALEKLVKEKSLRKEKVSGKVVINLSFDRKVIQSHSSQPLIHK